MRKSKKKSKVFVDNPKDRNGPYDYQSKQKSLFNNRPKRLRTRKAIEEADIEEYNYRGIDL
jgi:hypothetical protein